MTNWINITLKQVYLPSIEFNYFPDLSMFFLYLFAIIGIIWVAKFIFEHIDNGCSNLWNGACDD